MIEKLDENFIKSLVVIALGIVRGKGDPYELVNGAVEYLISNKPIKSNHLNFVKNINRIWIYKLTI